MFSRCAFDEQREFLLSLGEFPVLVARPCMNQPTPEEPFGVFSVLGVALLLRSLFLW